MHFINTQTSSRLIQWYLENKRDLPWRDTVVPYKIWVSEIILQQTRVNQGLDYYHRFVERFPDIQSLAIAEENEVLKYWQGLGYYSRARNLHKAAKQVVEQHNGVFPTDYKEILLLSGIGVYTAAAISAFAYNLPFAVVDGNVYRVLSRIFGIDLPIDSTAGIKLFQKIAQDLLDVNHPGTHNQAIMEFGALQCVPSLPNCELCPMTTSCIAFANGTVNILPVKSKKVKVRKRYFNYLYIKNGTFTYLQKRIKNDVWKNLYEFPLIEDDKLLEVKELLQHEGLQRLTTEIKSEITIKPLSQPVKHILSHQQIFAQFFEVEINDALEGFEQIDVKDIENYPVSRLMELFIENHLT